MHNYNATLVHWHHTLGCQCSSFYTYAVHKVVPVRAMNAKKLNYFTTSLRGKNEVEVKFENSMHNYNASLVHWHHTLGCQCSSFGTYAVHKVGPVKQSKPYWRTDGQTDGQTEIINLIVGLVTRNPPKNKLFIYGPQCDFVRHFRVFGYGSKSIQDFVSYRVSQIII